MDGCSKGEEEFRACSRWKKNVLIARGVLRLDTRASKGQWPWKSTKKTPGHPLGRPTSAGQGWGTGCPRGHWAHGREG